MQLALPRYSWPSRRVAILTTVVLATMVVLVYNSMILPISYRERLGWTNSLAQQHRHAQDMRIAHLKDIAQWDKPIGLKVIGLVFYGRQRYVSILECYLRRNLVENGGILDEVIFVAKTENKTDLAYLDDLLQSNPKYSADYHHEQGLNFSQMYGACKKGNIYIKIDDDVLYIEDSTLHSIVKQKIEHPEYLAVSANVVVNFATAWIHQHLGAVRPYLPELGPPKGPPSTWRVSELQHWSGPPKFDYRTFQGQKGHRWLPVPVGNPSFRMTRIDKSEYKLSSSGWHSWHVAAQQHYSLFHNIESTELWKYGFDVWDTSYNRVSINLIAMTGDDIVEMSPFPSYDEQYITMDYPKKVGRRVVVDGHGVAAHFGYASMAIHKKELRMEGTDILDRYRLYAEENICGK